MSPPPPHVPVLLPGLSLCAQCWQAAVLPSPPRAGGLAPSAAPPARRADVPQGVPHPLMLISDVCRAVMLHVLSLAACYGRLCLFSLANAFCLGNPFSLGVSLTLYHMRYAGRAAWVRCSLEQRRVHASESAPLQCRGLCCICSARPPQPAPPPALPWGDVWYLFLGHQPLVGAVGLSLAAALLGWACRGFTPWGRACWG